MADQAAGLFGSKSAGGEIDGMRLTGKIRSVNLSALMRTSVATFAHRGFKDRPHKSSLKAEIRQKNKVELINTVT